MLQAARKALRLIAVSAVAAAGVLATAAAAAAAGPTAEPSYADGNSYYMITPHEITDPSPQLLAHASELYLAAYPVAPGTTGPITLASGYQPNCNPCFHPGLPPQFVYHDHVLAGAPGLGTNGTAAEMKGPWRVIILLYKPSVMTDPTFQPLTSAAAVEAGERAGMFLPINPGAANPYEIDTGVVVICPIVSGHA